MTPWKDMLKSVPFYDFTLFVVLSLFTVGSACVGGTGREKREDNKYLTLNHEIRLAWICHIALKYLKYK